MNHYSKKDQGFTLIEAMIALIVLSLGLLALGQFQGSLLSTSGETKARSEALSITQEKIEALRNVTTRAELTQIDAGGSYIDGTLLTTGSVNDFQGIYALYDTDWTISEQPSTGSSGLSVRIKVDTSWTDASGDAQNIILYSYVAWDDPTLSTEDTTAIDNTGRNIPAPSGSGVIIDQSLEGWTSLGDHLYQKDNLFSVDPEGDGIGRLLSTNNLIKLTGTVSLGNGAPLTLADLTVLTSDAGICLYTSDSSSSPRSYICYVAGDWYGNLGVLGHGSGGNPFLCSASIRYTDNCILIDGIDAISSLSLANHTAGDRSCEYLGASGIIGELPNQNFEINSGGCIQAANAQDVQVTLVATADNGFDISSIASGGVLCSVGHGQASDEYSCAATYDANSIPSALITVIVTTGNGNNQTVGSCDTNSWSLVSLSPTDSIYNITLTGCSVP